MAQQSDFYLEEPNNSVWWLYSDNIGEFLFSFDRQKVYNLFRDYPYELTDEELEIFNAENPYWADFFKDRLKKISK